MLTFDLIFFFFVINIYQQEDSQVYLSLFGFFFFVINIYQQEDSQVYLSLFGFFVFAFTLDICLNIKL